MGEKSSATLFYVYLGIENFLDQIFQFPRQISEE
jgi:hypothetical protein